MIGDNPRKLREYIDMIEILSENRDLKRQIKEAEKMLTQVDVTNLPSYELGMEAGELQGERLLLLLSMAKKSDPLAANKIDPPGTKRDSMFRVFVSVDNFHLPA